MPGSVYVLGVLSDDLLATEASLWIWPAAPGPAQPELRIVRLDDDDALASIASTRSSGTPDGANWLRGALHLFTGLIVFELVRHVLGIVIPGDLYANLSQCGWPLTALFWLSSR